MVTPYRTQALVLIQNLCAGKFLFSRKLLGIYQEIDLSLATVRTEGFVVAVLVLVLWMRVMLTSKKYYVEASPVRNKFLQG